MQSIHFLIPTLGASQYPKNVFLRPNNSVVMNMLGLFVCVDMLEPSTCFSFVQASAGITHCGDSTPTHNTLQERQTETIFIINIINLFFLLFLVF